MGRSPPGACGCPARCRFWPWASHAYSVSLSVRSARRQRARCVGEDRLHCTRRSAVARPLPSGRRSQRTRLPGGSRSRQQDRERSPICLQPFSESPLELDVWPSRYPCSRMPCMNAASRGENLVAVPVENRRNLARLLRLGGERPCNCDGQLGQQEANRRGPAAASRPSVFLNSSA